MAVHLRYQMMAAHDARGAAAAFERGNLIDFPRGQPDFEWTDLARLTRDLAATQLHAFERAGLTLIVDAPSLPRLVCVDPAMWEKIVLRLLANAFRFTLKGGAAVALAAEGDAVLLTVADTGMGMAQSELPRLFVRRNRAPGGLIVVEELVRLHRGEVQVQSEEGKGSIFTVRIPVAQTGSGRAPFDPAAHERTGGETGARAGLNRA